MSESPSVPPNKRSAQDRARLHEGPRRRAPSPRGWPVVGHLPALRQNGMLPFLADCWRQHGDVFRVDMGVRALVLAHPDAIERVLASHRDNYVKGSTYDGVRRIIGNGLLALEGPAWRARRRLMQPAFHRAALAEMAGTMVESGRAYLNGLKARVPRTGVVDAHREMVKLTLDVVVAALFGRGLEGAAKVSYEALGEALELVAGRANGFALPEWVPTPANKKHRRTMAELEGAVYGVIAAARAREPEGTLLSMLLQSRDAETSELLSDVDLRDEVFTLFIAGHETTALTLTWMFTLLKDEPAVVARMRAEVDEVLGEKDPTFDDVARLRYLRQVVDETLRLAGPVAMNARTAVADDTLQGFEVKAGDIVMPFFWAAHRHPDFWPDPERFDPDRFTPENSKGRDPWSYLPFSGGQRICIGNTFSLVETVLLLAMLLQRLDFEVLPAQRIEPVALVTVRPSAPVHVRLTWRR